VRRLITSVSYLQRKLDRRNDGLFETEIKKFVENNFKVRRPSEEFDKIVNLMILSLEEKEKNINTQAKRNTLKKQGQTSCYICNREVDFSSHSISSGVPLSAQVEHLWPQSLGGSSELGNLQIVCQECNSKKEDFLDTSDYHYSVFGIHLGQDGNGK
jgi:hypothetical protein